MKKLTGNEIIRNYEDNNGFLTASDYESSSGINFSKVINKNEVGNNLIDIKVKCDKEDRNYRLMEHLFRNMAALTCNMKDEESARKVRKISK